MTKSLSIQLERTSDADLHDRTVTLAKKEQVTTLELLHHLHEVERRQLFAKRAFGSMWEYVMALGYGEAQASERISAMRMMFRVPEAREAIKNGRLTMTQAVLAERHFRAEERELGMPVPQQEVRRLLEQIEGKTKRETEKVLLSIRPLEIPIERIRAVTENATEVRFSIPEETRQAIQRYWELKGRCSLSALLTNCLSFYLSKKDPIRKQISIRHTRDVALLRPAEVSRSNLS